MSDGARRADFILQALRQQGRISAEDLSQRLGVNSSTIRRDLERLEQQNFLRRVHGGAVPIDAISYSTYAYDLTFQKNMGRQLEEKTAIALTALSLIESGDTIALSPGTTTTHLARCIRHSSLQDLTIITNALNIAMELSGMAGISLTVIGGLLLPDFFALVGPSAEQSLSQMYVAKAFIGVTGLHPEYGLTGPNQLEALAHRVTLQRAQQTFVLADHTKIGRVVLHSIAPITSMHALITDQQVPLEMLTQLKGLGIDVYQA